MRSLIIYTSRPFPSLLFLILHISAFAHTHYLCFTLLRALSLSLSLFLYLWVESHGGGSPPGVGRRCPSRQSARHGWGPPPPPPPPRGVRAGRGAEVPRGWMFGGGRNFSEIFLFSVSNDSSASSFCFFCNLINCLGFYFFRSALLLYF